MTTAHPATVDRASCVILAEPKPAPGLEAERIFIECLPADLEGTDASAYGDDSEAAQQIEHAVGEMPPGTVIISLSTICARALSHEGYKVAGHVHRVVCGTPDRLQWAKDDLDPQDPLVAPMVASALRNAITAIEEIIYVQDLPGFAGWPPDGEMRGSIYQVTPIGRIRRSNGFGQVA